jgi:hypothetical protein
LTGAFAWAWCRYWLISVKNVFVTPYTCAEVGCPNAPEMYAVLNEPKGPYCKLHGSPVAVATRRLEFLEKAWEGEQSPPPWSGLAEAREKLRVAQMESAAQRIETEP